MKPITPYILRNFDFSNFQLLADQVSGSKNTQMFELIKNVEKHQKNPKKLDIDFAPNLLH